MSQLRLGKRSIFLGLFVHDWLKIQHDFLVLNNLPHKQQQAQHALKMIARTLLQQVFELWTIRNNELHTNDPTKAPAHQHHLLQQKVTDIYAKKHLYQHIDRQLLDLPLSRRLAHSTQQLNEFVEYMKPIIAQSLKLAKQDDNHTKRPLKDYFVQPSPRTQTHITPPITT